MNGCGPMPPNVERPPGGWAPKGAGERGAGVRRALCLPGKGGGGLVIVVHRYFSHCPA